MPRHRDKVGKFLSKSPTTETRPSNEEQEQVDCEVAIQEKIEIFVDFLEEEARNFTNLSEEEGSTSHHTMADDGDQFEVFEFPIWETNGKTKMKNINPSVLPQFHGLTIEDPNTFFLNLQLFVGLTTTHQMIKSSKYFPLH